MIKEGVELAATTAQALAIGWSLERCCSAVATDIDRFQQVCAGTTPGRISGMGRWSVVVLRLLSLLIGIVSRQAGLYLGSEMQSARGAVTTAIRQDLKRGGIRPNRQRVLDNMKRTGLRKVDR
jgi:hypothetical protein